MTGPQGGGGSFNFTDAIDTHADYVVWMLATMRDRGADVVDVTKDVEDEYAEHCRVADIATAPLRDCLSYYNGHGDARARQPGVLRRRRLAALPRRRPGVARPLRVREPVPPQP